MVKIIKRIAVVVVSAAMVVSGGLFSGCDGILGEAFSALSAAVYAAPANWYEDYTYELSGTDIRLKRYNGSATEVTVPATAVIDGVTYQTVVCGNSKIFEDINEKALFSYITSLKSISFEHGVKGDNDLSNLFYRCEELISLDLSGLDTSNVTNMANVFYNCSGLINIDVSGFDTSNVEIKSCDGFNMFFQERFCICLSFVIFYLIFSAFHGIRSTKQWN